MAFLLPFLIQRIAGLSCKSGW